MINNIKKLNFNPNKVYTFFTLFYAYFVLALFDTAKGNFIPFFISDFSVSNSTIGIILSIGQSGSVFGAFLAGNASQKYGQKFTFIIGAAICSIVGLSSLFLSSAALLCVFYFVFNFGRSFLCISVDTIVPMTAIGYEVLFINLTHFMFGFGSFVGQEVYGNLLFNNVSWKLIYFGLGFLFILCLIFVLFLRVPKNRYILENKDYNKRDLYKNPVLIFFIICFALNVAAESVMIVWFINYMSSSYALSAIETAKYSSWFFVAFSFGRLIGGFILQKIGEMRGLKIFMGMAVLSIVLGLVLKQNGLYILSLTGFFISITYPTLTLLINSTFKEFASLAMGVIHTFTSVIGIATTTIIGFMNDFFGSYTTFYSGAVFMAISLSMLIIIDRKIRMENK